MYLSPHTSVSNFLKGSDPSKNDGSSAIIAPKQEQTHLSSETSGTTVPVQKMINTRKIIIIGFPSQQDILNLTEDDFGKSFERDFACNSDRDNVTIAVQAFNKAEDITEALFVKLTDLNTQKVKIIQFDGTTEGDRLCFDIRSIWQ